MGFRNKKLVRTVQIILGLVLIFFGLNGFFQFAPAPQFSEAAVNLFTALLNAGYFIPIVSIVFLITGLLFIWNRYVALGAIVLLPITINIVLFHIFLDIGTILFGLIVFILNIYLIGVYWAAYKPMLK